MHLVNTPKQTKLQLELIFLIYHVFDNSSFMCILVVIFFACLHQTLICVQLWYMQKKENTLFRPLLTIWHAFIDFTRFVIHGLKLFVFFSNIFIWTSPNLFLICSWCPICTFMLTHPYLPHCYHKRPSGLKHLEVRLYPLTVNSTTFTNIF